MINKTIKAWSDTLYRFSGSHRLGEMLPLLSARPAVTFLAAEHHRTLAGTKLCCLVTEAHVCEQFAQSLQKVERPGVEPATS